MKNISKVLRCVQHRQIMLQRQRNRRLSRSCRLSDQNIGGVLISYIKFVNQNSRSPNRCSRPIRLSERHTVFKRGAKQQHALLVRFVFCSYLPLCLFSILLALVFIMNWIFEMSRDNRYEIVGMALSHFKQWISTQSFGHYALAVILAMWIKHIISQLVSVSLFCQSTLDSSRSHQAAGDLPSLAMGGSMLTYGMEPYKFFTNARSKIFPRPSLMLISSTEITSDSF